MIQPPITTFTHKQFDPFNIRSEDICIEDIAHHLACINRFNGALKVPVSVAQHCVYVSQLVKGTGFELEALLHDGGEAYCGDMVKWMKESPEMEAFRAVEDRAQRMVFAAFGIDCDFMHFEVKEADKLMVRFEAEQSGITIPHPDYGPLTKAEKKRIGWWEPWLWMFAEQKFLQRFRALTK